MIELERHIEILLLKNDCVIVPGLGGFTASHIPARYDIDDNTFLPPLRTIGFNPKLCINDSLLIQSYTEAYDISYPEAQKRIENEVAELLQHLGNDGIYELNDIGIFSLNDEGSIEFKPCEAGILTPELYSLSSFEMGKLPIIGNEGLDDETKSPDNPRVRQIGYSNKKPFKKPLANTPSKDTDKKTISIKVSLIRNICAAIIAVILFFAWSTPVNNNKALSQSSMDYGFVHQLIGNGYGGRNTAEKKSPELNKVKKTTKPSVSSLNKKEEKASRKNGLTDGSFFCIVLASHVTRSNASHFVETLTSTGMDGVSVLDKTGESVKVIYGQYETLNIARNKLDSMRSNKYFKDAWIYKVKN